VANEATVSVSLGIVKSNRQLCRFQSSFNANVAGTKGPVPGAVTISTAGTNIDLSQLTTPGLCVLRNLDVTNYVEYGIREPATGFFYPLGEILPGEDYVLRLSRNIGEEYTNTGTGTSASTNTLHMKANSAAVVVSVEAYEV
jgi:hypothetical protein